MKKILTSRVFQGCSAGAVAIIVVLVVGFSIRGSADATVTKKAVVTTTTTSTSTSTTTTTTTLPHPVIQPAAVSLPLVGTGQSIGSGTNSPNVALYEQRLKDLKFDPGTVDNVYDAKTIFAVDGIQKAAGIPVSGRINDATVAAMNTFKYDAPTGSLDEPNRLEVSLTKQVAVLYTNYQVSFITTVSTGGGYHYCYNTLHTNKHVCTTAVTPTGKYHFYYRYKGWQTGDLGRLYNPVYFNGGIAVHGYPEVPNHAASHGCVRIPMYEADYFPSLVTNGEPVYVYGSSAVAPAVDTVTNITTTAPTTTAAPTTTVAPTTSAPTTSSSTTTTTT